MLSSGPRWGVYQNINTRTYELDKAAKKQGYCERKITTKRKPALITKVVVVPDRKEKEIGI